MKPELSIADPELSRLAGEAWRQYEQLRSSQLLVSQSQPIPFFGDLEAYGKSEDWRVVTVGLNPSWQEFLNKYGKPVQRFRLVSSELALAHPQKYIESLSEYFQNDPYKFWFNSFETIIEGTDASYGGKYGKQNNTALHTDLCSPLATCPAWTELGKRDMHFRQKLEIEGIPLWHDLIQYLRPDVIIASFAQRYLEKIEFTRPGVFNEIARFDCTKSGQDRKSPYVVKGMQRDNLQGGNDTIIFVFGRAVNLPFGSICTEAKVEIGRRIKESLHTR
jgi:hypothetical protein